MVQTKHLTIMFTDIKGFTSKTSRSSRAQLNKMLELHDELILPIFAEFGGEVIKTIGDAFLVTFQSPTDALLCGMKIQRRLAKHNVEAEADDRLEVRVAINSGEVTIKKNDVFGDAVNIAARLEGIAKAGEIYFTESVYLAMNKAEVPTASVGLRHFKGIPEEVKVYKVLDEKRAKKGLFSISREKQILRGPVSKSAKRKKILKWVGIVLLIWFLLALISSANQKKHDKELLEQQLEEGQLAQDQLWDEAHNTIRRLEKALDNREFVVAQKELDRLIRISKLLNNPPELEERIKEFEQKKQDIIDARESIR